MDETETIPTTHNDFTQPETSILAPIQELPSRYEVVSRSGHRRIREDKLSIRKEPPELHLEKSLTEGVSLVDRWLMISSWTNFPESPYYRSLVEKILENDVRALLTGQILDVVDEEYGDISPLGKETDGESFWSTLYSTEFDDAAIGLIDILDKTLLKLRYHFDLKFSRLKTVNQSEGMLAQQEAEDKARRAQKSMTLLVCRWMKELDELLLHQRTEFGSVGNESFLIERLILWLLRSTATLLKFSVGKFLHSSVRVTDFPSLSTFQHCFPALCLVPLHEEGVISRWTQDTVIFSVETLNQFWYESPWSVGLQQYVQHLHLRYTILMTSTFSTSSKVLNRTEMREVQTLSSDVADISLHHDSSAAIVDLGLYYECIQTTNGKEDESLVKDSKKIHEPEDREIMHVNETYIHFGERKLSAIILESKWLDDVELHHSTAICLEDFNNAMISFFEWLVKSVEDRSSKEFINHEYYENLFKYMVNPGEAVEFRTMNSFDAFNAESVVGNMRKTDIDRIYEQLRDIKLSDLPDIFGSVFFCSGENEKDEGWPSKEQNGLANIFDAIGSENEVDVNPSIGGEFGGEFEDHLVDARRMGSPEGLDTDTNIDGNESEGCSVFDATELEISPNHEVFTGAFRATIALQYSAFNNLFTRSEFPREWGDIMPGGAYDSLYEPSFLRTCRSDKGKHIDFPMIFKTAGSFFVHLPWEDRYIFENDIRYFSSGIGGAVYIALKETKKFITTKFLETPRELMNPILYEELTNFKELCDGILSEVFSETV